MEAVELAGIERRATLGLTGRSGVLTQFIPQCRLAMTHCFLEISEENVLVKHF